MKHKLITSILVLTFALAQAAPFTQTKPTPEVGGGSWCLRPVAAGESIRGKTLDFHAREVLQSTLRSRCVPVIRAMQELGENIGGYEDETGIKSILSYTDIELVNVERARQGQPFSTVIYFRDGIQHSINHIATFLDERIVLNYDDVQNAKLHVLFIKKVLDELLNALRRNEIYRALSIELQNEVVSRPMCWRLPKAVIGSSEGRQFISDHISQIQLIRDKLMLIVSMLDELLPSASAIQARPVTIETKTALTQI